MHLFWVNHDGNISIVFDDGVVQPLKLCFRKDIVMRKILVDGEEGDFTAFLETDDSVWGCGMTLAEAVGNLVLHDKDFRHQCKEFDIQIEFECCKVTDS